MEYVELVLRHLIEHLLDFSHRLEVPHGVEHQAAPDETRLIADVQRWYQHRALLRIWSQQLPQRNRPVEQPGVITGGDTNALGCDIQRIPLAVCDRRAWVALQNDRIRRRCALRHMQVQPTGMVDQAGQIIGGMSSRGIVVGHHDRCFSIDLEAAVGKIKLRWQWNE